MMSVWFALTEQHIHSHWHCCCFHHLRWQWEHYCCIWNSEQHDHITCSCCNIYWNVLMYDNISKRASYCIFNSQNNWQKSTHFDSESELHWCTTIDEFLSESMWYNFVWMKHCHQTEQEWPLSERSEHTKQAAVDQLKEQNWHQHS